MILKHINIEIDPNIYKFYKTIKNKLNHLKYKKVKQNLNNKLKITNLIN
jgi:hypothetical protein